MSSWFTVQFVLPVDNPVNNVRAIRVKSGTVFEVPVNLPDVGNVTYSQLLEMARVSGLLGLSTDLNNKSSSDGTKSITKALKKSLT
jgi:hypothetical protein